MKAIKSLLKSKRPILMGIVNLTPDSFSDGGRYQKPKEILKRALELEKQGADILDIGGESTGPKSKNVSLKDELDRVIPALRLIRKHTKLPISIDTYKSEVARQSLEEGADIINDITSMRQDPKMAKIVARYKCPIILMYSKDKSPRTTVKAKKYIDIIQTIEIFFKERISFAKKNGIKDSQIILDPGMGNFISSIPKYSFEIISRLREFKRFNCPILIGISRKSFIGEKLSERDEKGALLENIAYLNGASIIRTHNVKNTIACLKWS